MTLLATLTLKLAFLLLSIIALLLAGTFWLLWLHVRYRRAALAAEGALLARPLPHDLPTVAIQVPVYNEGRIVERAMHAAAAQNWPRDKLHIQILDGSTDETVEIAAAAAARLRAQGHIVTHLRRDNSVGYKAGALTDGMAALPRCQYFAILDVDYIPPPDFLALTMKPLLADSKLAFSQARLDYLNAEANTLTRSQAVFLDAHLSVEQATRSWAGHPLYFNGSCGIWRRAAIEAVGGWRGDLTEDLDLSIRAWVAGWRGTFLVTVPVPGELPSEWDHWVAQQRSWMIGSGLIARRMLSIIYAARKQGAAAVAGAILLFGTWWSTPLVLCTVPVAILAGLLNPTAVPGLIAAGSVLAIGGEVAGFISCYLANRLLRAGQMSAAQFFGRWIRFRCLGTYAILRNAFGYVEALDTSKTVFLRKRTPKSGLISQRANGGSEGPVL